MDSYRRTFLIYGGGFRGQTTGSLILIQGLKPLCNMVRLGWHIHASITTTTTTTTNWCTLFLCIDRECFSATTWAGDRLSLKMKSHWNSFQNNTPAPYCDGRTSISRASEKSCVGTIPLWTGCTNTKQLVDKESEMLLLSPLAFCFIPGRTKADSLLIRKYKHTLDCRLPAASWPFRSRSRCCIAVLLQRERNYLNRKWNCGFFIGGVLVIGFQWGGWKTPSSSVTHFETQKHTTCVFTLCSQHIKDAASEKHNNIWWQMISRGEFKAWCAHEVGTCTELWGIALGTATESQTACKCPSCGSWSRCRWP